MASKRKKEKQLEATGVAEIDTLAKRSALALDDYIRAVSVYIRQSDQLKSGPKKSAQVRLSNALARVFVAEFLKLARRAAPNSIVAGERKVSGGLRPVKADVSEIHALDGLRLAVELKPVNLAVGRAIWNRFGDLRTFAVNLHLKFPFCVVGGVLVVPTVERTKVSKEEMREETGEEDEEIEEAEEGGAIAAAPAGWRSTRHLIERAVDGLVRAGGRENEGEPAHLLEAIAVVAYDPFTAAIDPELPPISSGLRWPQFVQALAAAYDGRFEAG